MNYNTDEASQNVEFISRALYSRETVYQNQKNPT